MELQFTQQMIDEMRADTRRARPYASGEDFPLYFDKMDERDEATVSMNVLKSCGLWTEDDEITVFGKKKDLHR